MIHPDPAGIFFDMGGVLQDSSVRYGVEEFPLSFPDGLPDDTPVEWFAGMAQDCLDRFLAIPPPRPAFDCQPIISAWLAKRGEEPLDEAADLWLRRMEQWEARAIYPFVRPALETLRGMGLRMGVVSNTFTAAGYLREHFARTGILEFFEVTVFSAEFGFAKPHPAIFRHALDVMGLEPAEVWYVGDKPQRDMCGAHAAGLTAVLVESAHHDRIHDAPENVPDLRIPDVSGLPELVREHETIP